jgi:kynureninase
VITIPTAEELDRADPLARFRTHFAGAEDGVVAYLDGNSLGRPVVSTPDLLAEFARRPWGVRLIRGWDEAWMDEPFRVGDRLGEVILGAAAGQVLVGDSTSVLIYKLVRAAVDAPGAAGRTEIVIDRQNFPTDRYLLQGIAGERGLALCWVDVDPTAGVRRCDLDAVLGDQTALVVLSHVAYRSGFLADAAAITARVHDAGAMMLWDLSHSAASVPIHLDDWRVDLAVGCSYKYLNGGPGAPAFAYVRRDLHDRLQQPIWGWMGAEDPFEMGPDYLPAAGIRRFATGTPPILAMQPMKTMLELIADAGMEAIRAKSVALSERAIALTDERLARFGVGLASPRNSTERGSHVTISHPRFKQVTERLWERGVIPDFRPPDGIRIGLSPLSTSFAEVDRGIDAIADLLRDQMSERFVS